jgi:YqcI/YcgG family
MTPGSGARPGSVERFETVRLQTQCGFARGARLWGSCDWSAGGLEEAIAKFAQLLQRLAAEPPVSRPDGAVLEVADPAAGATVAALARTTDAVIVGLTARDPAPQGTQPPLPVDNPGWVFTFAGAPFFVVTFGPCYGSDSSRYAFELTASYLLFQTRESFVRRWAPGTDRLPDAARREIRESFARAGRPYDLSITLSPLEAHRYVKPNRLGAPPVRWWLRREQHDDKNQ